MMRLGIAFLLAFFLFPLCYASENVFYVLRHLKPEDIAQLNNHSHSINMIISQAYKVDENGMVAGYVDPNLLNFTAKNKIKLVAMVTNVKFDRVKVHRFLANKAAKERAILALLSEAQSKHYYGIQFDFEMVRLDDRAALTQFLQAAASELHKKGFSISVAVAPVVSNNPQPSDYLKTAYNVWEGAYDLSALSSSCDFLSIMTYDQHTDGTTPGPVASLLWDEQVIKHILNFVPPYKISLGIPTYSSFWYTGRLHGRLSMHMDNIGYNTVQKILQKRHAALHWNEVDNVDYAAYEHNWLTEYLFVENAKSFRAKLKLAKKYHLRGISVFRFGIEDPNIWKVLEG